MTLNHQNLNFLRSAVQQQYGFKVRNVFFGPPGIKLKNKGPTFNIDQHFVRFSFFKTEKSSTRTNYSAGEHFGSWTVLLHQEVITTPLQLTLTLFRPI